MMALASISRRLAGKAPPPASKCHQTMACKRNATGDIAAAHTAQWVEWHRGRSSSSVRAIILCRPRHPRLLLFYFRTRQPLACRARQPERRLHSRTSDESGAENASHAKCWRAGEQIRTDQNASSLHAHSARGTASAGAINLRD